MKVSLSLLLNIEEKNIILYIGLQELLSTLNRPGSTLEYFKNNSGKIVDFKKNSNIEIPKFTGVISFKYAKTIN